MNLLINNMILFPLIICENNDFFLKSIQISGKKLKKKKNYVWFFLHIDRAEQTFSINENLKTLSWVIKFIYKFPKSTIRKEIEIIIRIKIVKNMLIYKIIDFYNSHLKKIPNLLN